MRLLEVVGRHRSRWESVRFEGGQENLLLLQRLLDLLHPPLKSLTLDITSGEILEVLPQCSPVVHLSLCHIVPSKNLALSGLTTLSLRSMSGRNAPNVSRVLGILEICRDLRKLGIDDLYPRNGEVPADKAFDVVARPNLRVLDVKDVPEAFAADLLRSLQADSLTSSTLDLHWQGHPHTDLPGALFEDGATASPPPLLLLRKAAHPVLRIEVSLYRASATVQDSEHHLNLVLRSNMQGIDLSVSLRVLYPCISLVSEVHLELHGRIIEYDLSSDNMPNLTRLIVHDAWTAQRVVEYLLEQDVESTCPKLELLHLEGWWDQGPIAQLVVLRQPGLKVLWGPLEDEE